MCKGVPIEQILVELKYGWHEGYTSHSTHLNGSDTLTKDLVMDSEIFMVLFAIEVEETSNVIGVDGKIRSTKG